MNTTLNVKFNPNSLVDLYNDKAFVKISSLISQIPSNDIKEHFMKVVDDLSTTGIKKCAGVNAYLLPEIQKFPIDTPDNVALSALYFHSQKDSIPENLYKSASIKLDTLCEVYDIPAEVYNFTSLQKEAESLEDYLAYLLPTEKLFPITQKEDLIKAASLFESNISKFLIPQRVEFSRNFIKQAMDYKGVIPKTIAKYASMIDSDFDNAVFFINKRAEKIKKTYPTISQTFSKIAEELSNIDTDTLEYSNEDLTKLAELIYSLDKEAGLDLTLYDKKIPDAFSTIFNKEAEDIDLSKLNKGTTDVENYSKADIIATFGEDVLEELEDLDGNIDQAKAKVLYDMLNRK